MKKSTSISPAQPSLLHVARHESGHALIATLQGLPLQTISVHPTKGARGHVQLAEKLSNLNLASLAPKQREDLGTRLLLVGLGGAASLNVIENDPDWASAQEDLEVYDDTIEEMGIPLAERDDLFFRMYSRAVRLIFDNREMLEKLAAVLVNQKVMSGEDVKREMEKR